jgi:hypothetical protein
MAEKRISGYLSETPRYRPENHGERIPLYPGDKIWFRGMYYEVEGFTRNPDGTGNMRVKMYTHPKDAAEFIRWCQQNPHHVKRVDDVGRLEV